MELNLGLTYWRHDELARFGKIQVSVAPIILLAGSDMPFSHHPTGRQTPALSPFELRIRCPARRERKRARQ